MAESDEQDDGHNHQGAATCSTEPVARVPTKSEKHAISSAKLKVAKDKANEEWRKHLVNSERISQIMGPSPIIAEQSNSEIAPPPQRFSIHTSHVTVAVRSIIHCKVCGYWASKKSQNLQKVCPGKPQHSHGAHALRRLLAGLHPDAKVKA